MSHSNINYQKYVNQCHQYLLNYTSEILPWKTTYKTATPNLVKKIQNFVLFVFAMVLTLALYLSNPSLFVLGFVAGVTWDQTVQDTISKLKAVWQHHNWAIRAGIFMGAYMALPVSVATVSFFVAANLGSMMYKNTQFLKRFEI